MKRPRALARRDFKNTAAEFLGAGRLPEQFSSEGDSIAVRQLSPFEVALVNDCFRYRHHLPHRLNEIEPKNITSLMLTATALMLIRE
jgi:hypothetical protein